MSYTKILVQNILAHPREFLWSVQGLGMMRVYLSDDVRLHIWDDSLKVPGVTALHTHPWHLHSTIIAGIYRQRRYVVTDAERSANVEGFNVVTIKCGEEASMKSKPTKVYLIEQPQETYREGETYMQTSNEIHQSFPENGTVTIVKRSFLKDRDHAQVFWRGTTGWVDAAPRPATLSEIESITIRALKTWF